MIQIDKPLIWMHGKITTRPIYRKRSNRSGRFVAADPILMSANRESIVMKQMSKKGKKKNE